MIEDIFKRNGFDLSDQQVELFYTYMQELKKWNKVHRLTAIEEEEQIVIRHFVDSLTLALCFEQKGLDVKGKSVCDVGSGGGFPGVPLKIYYGPQINLTLVESVSKKCAFLEYVKAKLGLDYRVLCKRAEQLRENSFDIVVCRALGKLEDIVPMLIRLSREFVFIMKGKELPKGYEYCKINTYDIKDSYILFLPKRR
ncbi:methyltransferase GidB [Hydrogenobacter thermophilus TK-6]|uniref:Ribosomal RNA small subunit methyltransferase G n=1 Tax=Hydrogenobacter thermophilus (strain DSM 6534 / IAM 12695 / TK-6) TaxID=608538 RepID=D3DIJ5_HYDTT|nr:16S rRNA (guanine(527)-N(7))-methyltransferase RsmG [Hydrogenobacter thermophilus]ADO45573.1 methyltransferase GidB [Hydrogenobacter thermophilus TK-6]BAI69647.1 glucose inhibited division protein [Hydrogenobacter thermophilus TK-6]